MKEAIVDFETNYDKEVSVVDLGTPNYVRLSNAYVVGVMVDGEARCGEIKEMAEFCGNLAKDPTVKPVAANSNFDQAWWESLFEPFKPDWHCLLDHSAFHQFPRNLAGLAGVVLGEKVDKSLRDDMKGKRYEDLPKEEQVQLQEYCLNDVVKEAECLSRLAPMSAFEERVAAHTRMISRRGVAINLDLVESDKTKLEAMRFDAFKKIPWHADEKPLSYNALVKYCNARNIPVPKSLAKTDEECADLMTDNAELSEVVGQMRRFRRANAMIKKIATLRERTTPEGILPLEILYCAAPHTRRWSSKGFNIQNLDKEPLITRAAVSEGQEDETVWTRSWIVPRPGKIFLIRDYSQVEPRVLNWLAGNDELLEAMRLGYSYYEAYARIARDWKGAPGTIKAEYGKQKYTLLKNECLGLGYGMGADKFVNYAAQNGNEISFEAAKAVVDGFRAGNTKVTKFWRRLDGLIVTAARDKSRHLALDMPSGDLLQYFNIRTNSRGYEGFVTKNDFGQQSRQPRLWGGTLAENVTQRAARDILANAVVNLEAAGIAVAFHCHDEVICEVDIDNKEDAAAEADRILKTPPEWAEGLPLGVEGDFAEAYTK